MRDDIDDLISEVGNSLVNYYSTDGYRKIGCPAEKRYVNACEAIRTKFNALNQRIAELEELLRWIPVEEGLPEPEPLILYDVRQVENYDILRGICYYWHSGWIDHSNGSNWNERVTHYRRIPKDIGL